MNSNLLLIIMDKIIQKIQKRKNV